MPVKDTCCDDPTLSNDALTHDPMVTSWSPMAHTQFSTTAGPAADALAALSEAARGSSDPSLAGTLRREMGALRQAAVCPVVFRMLTKSCAKKSGRLRPKRFLKGAHPPAEASEIANLFSGAVEALMDGDRHRANELIKCADRSRVRDYVDKAWGENDPEIHLWHWNPAYKARRRVPEGQRDPRKKPGAALLREIFERDAWRCRYCGIKVMTAEAFKKLRKHDLESLYWGTEAAKQHPGAILIQGVYDHVVPHSTGGRTVGENLVTACWPCNAAKGDALLEEANLADPMKRPPAERDDWEGLTRLLKPAG